MSLEDHKITNLFYQLKMPVPINFQQGVEVLNNLLLWSTKDVMNNHSQIQIEKQSHQ
jgi:hypothetical protein